MRIHDPDVDDRLDEHEQADEEEERRPLDLLEHLLGAQAGDERQDGRADERDRAGLEPERAGEQEAERRSGR